MLVTILRTVIMYVFVVATLRIMGKRQIGELEASELVVTIIISDIAAMPITNTDVPLATNVLAIFVLTSLEIILSFIAYKSPAVRTALYGKPSTFFKNGKFNQDEMLKQRFNVADIMEEVRGNGICSLSEVEYIVMETNGRVSVVLKSENSPVTTSDLQIKKEPIRLSFIIIDNGTVIGSCMKSLGLNNEWLNNTLKEYGLTKASEVFYLSFEQDSGKTVLVPKDKR